MPTGLLQRTIVWHLWQIQCLQSVQNAAARLVTGTHQQDHITPVFEAASLADCEATNRVQSCSTGVQVSSWSRHTTPAQCMQAGAGLHEMVTTNNDTLTNRHQWSVISDPVVMTSANWQITVYQRVTCFQMQWPLKSLLYRVGQKRGHFILRPITLEILNRSLPNLAQIKSNSSSEHHAIIYLNQFGKIMAPSSE